MNLYIPDIGDQIRLTEDWEFPLFREHRNDSLITRIQPLVGNSGYGNSDESIGCCLPTGTVLQIDRVYIRKGSSNAWSSITFLIKQAPGDKEKPKFVIQQQNSEITDPTPQKLKGARFWAKLAQVNEIEFEPIEEEDRI
jgi:hypothetical protein